METATPVLDRSVRLQAKPEPITIDPATTAALVVDMQNDFGAKGGMIDRAGVDISVTRRVIEPTARALASMRKAGIAVVYLKHGHQPDLSDLGPPDSPHRIKHLALGVGAEVTAPDGRASRVLIRDTWNTDILDELEPEAADAVIYKTRYSGFFGTDLDAMLKARGIKCLVVVGVTTSVCIEATIRDAMYRDYACILLADCTGELIGREFQRSNHEASLWTIETRFGWVSSSSDLVRALEASAVDRAA